MCGYDSLSLREVDATSHLCMLNEHDEDRHSVRRFSVRTLALIHRYDATVLAMRLSPTACVDRPWCLVFIAFLSAFSRKCHVQ